MPQMEYGDFVKYSFYRVGQEWLNRGNAIRAAGAQKFAAVVDNSSYQDHLATYSTVGTRGDTHFLLVQTAPSIMDFHNLQASLNRTSLGRNLEQVHSYLAIRLRTQYKHGGGRPDNNPKDYLIVYPMVKKREWYGLELEERQAMMNAHFRVGRKYPSIRINTTYSFGLDDPEFVVAFETQTPSEFVSLVKELREIPVAQYTETETPIFTALKMPIRAALEACGAT